ncbi:MAG: TonB-dependent receptor plug domain-containing protein, partial [Erythrobacter sp.]|nr:TonB-dependent receptor plug domain-containing protein [Erythrobacter sp.]
MYPKSFRSALLLCAALSAITPVTAYAQDEAANDDATTDAQASQSNDIIVTARRRSETAQEIPLAISVIGGPQIESTGAFNIDRVQQLAPTLQLFSSNPRNTAVNIRGLGVPFGLTSDGFEQGVGIYIDDV